MGQIVSDTFERIRGRLPASLSPSALARCTRIFERIPDEAASHYLEYRLNSGCQIDVLTCTGKRTIAASFDQQLGPERSRRWAENVEVLREWASGDSELSLSPLMYFEYDGGDDFIEEEPEANLSVLVEPEYLSRNWLGLHGSSSGEVALGRAAFRRLLPASQREPCLAVLDRLYAALPPLGAIPHAPVMTARKPVTAKPYVILPRESVFDFLREIGWPGSMEALRDLLATYYSPFRHSIYLDLTITDRVEERLGLATSQFQRREADFSTLDWWKLPKELQNFKDELRDWTGHTEERQERERVWLRRWLDTKAVLNSGKVEYKAYLGFGPTRPPPFC
jgi:hypothetical protein